MISQEEYFCILHKQNKTHNIVECKTLKQHQQSTRLSLTPANPKSSQSTFYLPSSNNLTSTTIAKLPISTSTPIQNNTCRICGKTGHWVKTYPKSNKPIVAVRQVTIQEKPLDEEEEEQD